MRVRKQDQNGDYVFGSGQEDFYKDSPDGVAQIVQTRLLLFRGEWFLDSQEGTPYLQGVIGKSDEQVRDDIIKQRVLNTEGVLRIVSYESNLDRENRKLSVSLTIDTIYGNNSIQVVI